MSEQIRLRSCPFCGSTEISAKEEPSFRKMDEVIGVVQCCGCGVQFVCERTEQEFVKIEGDMYRLVPARKGLDIAVEKWNTRANSVDLSPVGEENNNGLSEGRAFERKERKENNV